MDRPTVYIADWVLPVSAPPIHNGAVQVTEQGVIARVGPRETIDAPPDALVVELGNAVIIPGLINVHAHPELSVLRGALEDLPFRQWILGVISLRGRLDEEDLVNAARWTAIEALRAGITTMGATEASSASMTALGESGMRGIVYREVFGPDPRGAEESMAELRGALASLRPLETELVRLGISPHAPFSVSDELFAASARLAIEDGLPMAIHIAESRAERELVAEGEGEFAASLRARGIATPRRGATPVQMLDALGVLAARPLLIHCIDVNARDIEAIAAAGCAVAHCPIANAKLGHGIAPVPELLDAGVAVGIGTDSVASNNRLDLIEEARVASLLQRGSRRSWRLLDASELLRLCTIDGARALGLDQRVGTLETGKDADLCAISLAAPHVRPVHDPAAAIFHSARAGDVILTAVRGRLLQRNGRIVTLDAEKVGNAIENAAARAREGR